MQSYEIWDVAGHTLEYYDEDHQYIVDGICVDSITQIMKCKFGKKYDRVDAMRLQRASEKGTEVHEAIERYCKTGVESELIEVKNFKFLKKQHEFEVVENEVPVILFGDDKEPIGAGRVDLVIERMGMLGGADIKRTATLDKEYLSYQLNLYRIAYRQCYGVEWKFLRGVHLRENTRKFVQIPINEEMAWKLVDEYFRKESLNE